MATWTNFLELEADPEYSDTEYAVWLSTDQDLFNGEEFSGELIRNSLSFKRVPATSYFDNWLYTTYLKFSFVDTNNSFELKEFLESGTEFRCQFRIGSFNVVRTFIQRPSISFTDEDPQVITMTFSDRLTLMNDVPYADNFITDGASRSRLSNIIANCLYEVGFVDGITFYDMGILNNSATSNSFFYNNYLNNADYQGKSCGQVLKEILQSCGCYIVQWFSDRFYLINKEEYRVLNNQSKYINILTINSSGSYTNSTAVRPPHHFNLSKTPFRVLNRNLQSTEGFSDVIATPNSGTPTSGSGISSLTFTREFEIAIPHFDGGFVDSGGTAISTGVTPSPYSFSFDARTYLDITAFADFYSYDSRYFIDPTVHFAGEAFGNFGLPLDSEYVLDSGRFRQKTRLYELEGSEVSNTLDNTNYRLKSSRNKPDLVCAVDGTTGSEFHYSQDRGNSWSTNTSLASMPNSLSYACTFVNETYYVKRGGDSNWWYFNVATETAGNYDTTQTDILDATDYYDSDIKLAWVRSIDKNIYTQDEGATSFSTTTVSGITGNMKCIDAWFDVNGVGQTIAIATNSNEIAYNSTVSATGWTVVSTGSLQPERITVYKDVIYGIGHVTSGSTGYLFKVENGVYTQLGDELSTRISGFGPSVSSIEDIIRFDRYLIYAFDTSSFVNIDYFDLNKNDWRVDKAAPTGGLPTGRAITLTGHFYNNQWTNFGRDHITFIA